MNRWRTLPVALSVITVSGFACAEHTGPATSVSTPPRTSEVGTIAPTQPEIIPSSERRSIPVGQEMDVRLRNTLSSETASVEQRFQTTTVVDLMQDGRVLVPAGSVVEGVVSNVDKAGHLDRTGSLTLTFDRMRVRGREHRIRATATQIFESRSVREDVGKAGVGGGVGAIVGGLVGGLKGAILGATIGAGGAIAATEGTDVTLPAGSIVRIRMDSPLRLG